MLPRVYSPMQQISKGILDVEPFQVKGEEDAEVSPNTSHTSYDQLGAQCNHVSFICLPHSRKAY